MTDTIDHDALAEIKTIAPIATITPQQVLDQARSPNSALHRFFIWDDTEAANAYRLIQATKVLRAAIKILPKDAPKLTRIVAGVSGPADRTPHPIAAAHVDLAGEAAALRRLAGDIDELRAEYSGTASMAAIFSQFREIIRNRLESLNVRNLPDREARMSAPAVRSETAIEQRATQIAMALTESERKTFVFLPPDGAFKKVSGPGMSALIRKFWHRFPEDNTIGLSGPADEELASLGALGRLIRGRVMKLVAENA